MCEKLNIVFSIQHGSILTFWGKGVRIEHFRVGKHDEPYVKLSEFVFGVQTPDLDLWVPICPGV